MDYPPESPLVLKAWLVFVLVIGILGNSKLAAANSEQAGRKLAANIPGSISIDCGVTSDYFDDVTGISYKSDTDFISTGTNEELSSEYFSPNRYYGSLLKNLRSFPQGKKNCYTLKPEQGKGNKYLITAFFRYGNYDNKNQTFKFDLYLGVNFWATMQMTNSSSTQLRSIIHVPSSDVIFVCLVKTGSGIPFISALELRPLDNSSYPLDFGTALSTWYNIDVGPSEDHNGPSTNNYFSYRDDFFDRIWQVISFPEWAPISTSENIDTQGSNDAYKVPPQVLRTAIQPSSGYDALNFSVASNFSKDDYEFRVYFHFTEVANLSQGQKRKLYITLNGEKTEPIITLDYLKPLSIRPQNAPIRGPISFVINRTTDSDLPPILNAFEIYQVLQFNVSATNPEDVAAIMEIKETYGITRESWQGDPCVPLPLPSDYIWNGLTCSPDKRIISLNLSSSLLKGNMSTSLSKLKAIQSFNLKGNKLTGPVPDALLKRSRDGKLKLSVENLDICQSLPCKKKKKKEFVIPVVASSVAVLILLFIFSALAIYKKKRQGGDKEMKQKMLIQELGGHLIKKGQVEKDGQTSQEVQFLSFESITTATNNFSTENKLGEGGFGPVYEGKLLDGKEIAIKRLSRSSVQGLVEFKNEALLIAKLQHANLVRLLGFCIQEEEKLLIYEYMPNKSLDFFLFDSTKKKLLTWKIRLNIIEGIFQGLVYLHKYSRPRVIHRDLKAGNILLDDEMNPKISDFGMARIVGLKASEEMTNRVVGTYGYMAPEYAINGVVSIKTDVFNFGVLLLEIVSGKKNNRHYHSSYLLNLIGYAWQLWNEDKCLELIDPTLDESCPPNEALRCIHIGLLCVQDHATDRPTMPDVVSMLSNETIQLAPPKQPAFFVNTVVENSEVPEIQLESYSINNLTISVLETR